MTTSTLYHTQGIRGCHYKKTERKGNTEYYHICSTAKQLNYPCGGSKQTSVHSTNQLRQIRGLPISLKNGYLCTSKAHPLPGLRLFCKGTTRVLLWPERYLHEVAGQVCPGLASANVNRCSG